MDACEVLIKQQCKRVCIRSLEEHVIRPMAAHLRTIPRNCDVLAMSAADLEALRRQHPREYDYLGSARSESGHIKGTRSELFPMDGPMSKYHNLFDHRPGFDALRSSFLNSSCDHVHRVVQQFEHQVATLHLAATDLLHIQELVTSLRRMLQLRQGLLEPNNFAARAWPAYRAAMQDQAYYLSELELVIIAAMRKRKCYGFLTTRRDRQVRRTDAPLNPNWLILDSQLE